MTKELWINLPVKDVNKSKEFFTKLGFSFNPKRSKTDESACLVIGTNNVIVMLFKESGFKNFTKNEIADTKKASEVLFSIGADSKAEVDEMANKAVAAGGSIFGQPTEVQGWMYGCGFSDLDGHRWNLLYMDMNAMPKG
jgi:predicted lactoylglutathione lyase